MSLALAPLCISAVCASWTAAAGVGAPQQAVCASHSWPCQRKGIYSSPSSLSCQAKGLVQTRGGGGTGV